MRWLIIGGIVALVLTVYALVDLTVTDDRRIRRLNRILWVVLIVVLPIVGPAAWLSWGKGPRAQARPFAPDDDPSFSRNTEVSDEEADRRIAELEAQLAALDAEDFTGGPSVEQVPDEAAEAEPEAKPKSKGSSKPPADTETTIDGAADDDRRHRAPGDGGDAARA